MAVRKPVVIVGDELVQLPEGDTLAGVEGGGSGGGGVVGQIQQFPIDMQPDGYLDCDGASYDLADYPELYAAIGDTYQRRSQFMCSKPWKNQYDSWVTDDNPDFLSWATSVQALPKALGGSQAIVTKNRVYLLGGKATSGVTDSAFTAVINPDGTFGSWSEITGALPAPRYDAQILVTRNKVYLTGGMDSSDTVTSTTYWAPINSDGTISFVWTAGVALPQALSLHQLLISRGNRALLLGGYDGTASVNTTYTIEIDNDGLLIGPWEDGPNLPANIYATQAFRVGRYVFYSGGVSGGTGGTGTSYINTAYPDGRFFQPWGSASAGLGGNLAGMQAIITSGKARVFSGFGNAETAFPRPFWAGIERFNNTILSAYTRGNDNAVHLPVGIYKSQAVMTKDHVYLLGGMANGDTPSNVILVAPFRCGKNDYSCDCCVPGTENGKFSVPFLRSRPHPTEYNERVKYMILART